MTSPVLSDIRIELAGIDINRTYPRDVPDLFEGGQIVVAGRYRQSGKTTIRINGQGRRRAPGPRIPRRAGRRRISGSSYDFVERLWVVRRLGDLIDQIDLHGQNKELVDELVALSTKYGILTPYTSFLADERVSSTRGRPTPPPRRNVWSSSRRRAASSGSQQRDFKHASWGPTERKARSRYNDFSRRQPCPPHPPDRGSAGKVNRCRNRRPSGKQ